MNLLRIARRLRPSLVTDAVVMVAWRHRTEALTWLRSVPELVGASPTSRSKTLDEVRRRAAAARTVDRQRSVSKRKRAVLRDRVRDMTGGRRGRGGTEPQHVSDKHISTVPNDRERIENSLV